ncbi:MAG: histidinol-phosphatase HisJ [Pseudomonadota bacterium]
MKDIYKMIKKNYKLSDLHMHTNYSDGLNSPEEMIKSAISKGLIQVGISDHYPISYETPWTMHESRVREYLEELKTLKIKFAAEIDVLIGFEVDYFLDCEEHLKKIPIDEVDYLIGSVHLFSQKKANNEFYAIDYTDEDFNEVLQLKFGNIENLIKDYFELYLKAAETKIFSFLGHFDLYKKFNIKNKYFDAKKEKYLEMTSDKLNKIKSIGSVLEINTSGFRKGLQEPYPSFEILDLVLQKKVPYIVNSDAHSVGEIAQGFERVKLKKTKTLKNQLNINY